MRIPSSDQEQYLDVFCLGHASYDQVMGVSHHPSADEKLFASELITCGGGPAANAAVCVARLGLKAGFGGYLGNDSYGRAHEYELIHEGIDTSFIVHGNQPTPLSVVLVKPDGQRSLVNYKGDTQAMDADALDFSNLNTRIILVDGHEPALSLKLLNQHSDTPSVLDAGSLHAGTESLITKVSDLVCSEKFAIQYAGTPTEALEKLAMIHPKVVITLGEKGLIWRCGIEQGQMTAPQVKAIDTTGAGDAFHGAYAVALARNMNWIDSLQFASVAGALACCQLGARTSIAHHDQHQHLLQKTQFDIQTSIAVKPL